MNIESYLQSYRISSQQVSRREIEIVLRELQRVLDIDGDVVEFGCYEGTTSIPIATMLKNTQKQLYLYDSFEGLPEKQQQDISPAGQQFKTGELLASKKVLVHRLKQAGVGMPKIKKAWFADLTENDVPHQVSFAFLDGDYYESVKTPLELIESFLMPGATIIVDDYASDALPGTAKAVDEWMSTHGRGTMRIEASLAIIHL